MNDDAKLLAALEADWEYVKHLDNLRVRLAAVYMVAMFGAGFAAVGNSSDLIRGIGCLLGLLITLFCWSMTHKWNFDFVNMITKADACSRRLTVTSGEGVEPLHSYLPFPTRDPHLKSINVRLMFGLLYGTFTVVWSSVLVIVLVAM